ncbi:MAG: hypothetical protein LBM77_09425 [Spirochaetaceae bacterium]|jgi:hypothetical protein|nr:hypothetical protein [Spirochaetaceae bacterium]
MSPIRKQDVSNLILLSYLKRIEQRLIALERVNHIEVEENEEDEEDEAFYDPDFPNMTEQGWKNLAEYLESCDTYFKNGGKGYTLEETVAHARAAVAKVREAKLAVPA